MNRSISLAALFASMVAASLLIIVMGSVASADPEAPQESRQGSEIAAQVSKAVGKSQSIDTITASISAAPVAGTASSTSVLKPISSERDPSERSGSILFDAQRLTIKFANYEKLSGDYLVSAEHTISIAGLGVISIASMTSSELKSKLSELIIKAGGRESDISVEIADYRPVFVTGLVRNSGSYPWKPGMIVLHAETLSGGVSPAGGAGGGGSVLATDNEVIRQEKAELDLKRVLATLARLEAEKKGTTIIDVSERLAELAGRQEASDLILQQSSVLLTRRASVDAQFASLEQGASLIRKELDGLKAQLVRLKENTAARRAMLVQIDDLMAKRLVRTERKLDEQSKVAELEEREANITVGIVRSQGVLLGLQRDIDNLKRERQSDIDTEMFKLQREAAQLEVDIRGAVNAQKKLAQADPVRVRHDGGSALRYEIFRGTDTKAAVFTADRFTALRPGDVVVISSASPEELTASNTRSAMRETAAARETVPAN